MENIVSMKLVLKMDEWICGVPLIHSRLQRCKIKTTGSPENCMFIVFFNISISFFLKILTSTKGSRVRLMVLEGSSTINARTQATQSDVCILLLYIQLEFKRQGDIDV